MLLRSRSSVSWKLAIILKKGSLVENNGVQQYRALLLLLLWLNYPCYGAFVDVNSAQPPCFEASMITTIMSVRNLLTML